MLLHPHSPASGFGNWCLFTLCWFIVSPGLQALQRIAHSRLLLYIFLYQVCVLSLLFSSFSLCPFLVYWVFLLTCGHLLFDWTDFIKIFLKTLSLPEVCFLRLKVLNFLAMTKSKFFHFNLNSLMKFPGRLSVHCKAELWLSRKRKGLELSQLNVSNINKTIGMLAVWTPYECWMLLALYYWWGMGHCFACLLFYTL